MLRRAAIAALAAAAILQAGAVGASAAGTPTLYVSAAAAGDPSCTAASKTNPFATIAGALACAGDGSVLMIGAGTFAGHLAISHSVTLQGIASPGASVITSSGGLEGPAEITAAPGTSVTVRDLTIDGGRSSSALGSAGITAAAGSLTLIDTTVRNTFNGGVVVRSSTGGAAVSLLETTVTGNLSAGESGAVRVEGTEAAPSSLTAADSTIALNTANSRAAVETRWASARITNATIAANSAYAAPAGLVATHGEVTLTNTILAANTSTAANSECGSGEYGTLRDGGGHNLIAVANPVWGCTLADMQNFDRVGTSASPVEARLGTLTQAGGVAPTIAPQAGSPALGAGDPAACGAAPVSGLDQRHARRNAATRGTCDIGAYDTGAPVSKLYVSATAKSDPACAQASKSHPFATIGGALSCASNDALVLLGEGSFAAALTVAHNVTLQGAGKPGATVIVPPAGSPSTVPELTLAAGSEMVLKSLTVDGGWGTTDFRPGIGATAGSVALMDTTVRNTYGGGIRAYGGGEKPEPATGSVAVSLLDSTVTGVVQGAGIEESGPSGELNTLTVSNSTIAGNNSNNAVAGIFARFTRTTLTGATITANANGSVGVGGLLADKSVVAMSNTLLAGNTSAGGAPDCSGPGATLEDGGHNILGVRTPETGFCTGLIAGQRHDLVGTPAEPLAPKLAAPAQNGGLTPTAALLPGSPAIGAGDAAICAAAPLGGSDQRHASRNAGTRGTCDIGAYDTGGV